MFQHSWIAERLGIVVVSEQIRLFLSESMKAWRVDLTCNDQSLGRVDIKRVIFQGDSLSTLLLCYVDFKKVHINFQVPRKR